MDIVARTIILGVAGSIVCLLLKKGNPELGLVLAIAVSLLVMAFTMEVISGVVEFLEVLRGATDLSPAILNPVLKTVGIGILTRLAADICKDANQGAIASAVEMAGTAAAIYLALPLMKSVFEMIGKML